MNFIGSLSDITRDPTRSLKSVGSPPLGGDLPDFLHGVNDFIDTLFRILPVMGIGGEVGLTILA